MIKRRRWFALVLLALPVLLTWGVAAHAEDKTFISIASIPGESTDAAHPAWIDAYALDAGITAAGGSSSAFQDIAVLKGTDKATPGLNDAISRQINLGLVTIEVCRNTAPQQCYYKIELTNTKMSGTSLSGSSCVGPGACTPTQTESVSFKYTKIRWTYTPWTGGVAGTPVTKCFDITLNLAC
jgi:type VI secretion system Hcp family effector